MATHPTKTSSRITGEPYVWLTSMGLTTGLFMILFLLGLVLYKGLEAFWPRRVAEVTIAPNSPYSIADSRTFGGEIVKEQEKISHQWAEADDGAEPQAVEEIQFFLGNKDSYGLSFFYVEKSHIEEISYPSDIIRLERVADGPAIGYPVSLQHTERGTIPFQSDDFLPLLRQLIHESEEIRDSTTPDPESNHQFTYRLLSGAEITFPIRQILSFYFPNQLGPIDRLSLFAAEIWVFLSEQPREANTEGGIFPAIFGTFVMTLLMSVAVTPFGIMAAIYLREYARQGPLVRTVRIAVNNLAGVPSIVFGVFGLGFFVYFLGGTIDQLFFREALPTPTFGTGGILWASLTLALMTVPVVIVATEEALAAVSRGSREGSLACGASKWQTMQRVVLPAAAPGILTGLILAMARGAGEVAPLMLVGVIKYAPELPLNLEPPFVHLDQKFMHLGFHIYDLGFQSPDSEAALPMVFATTLFLIALVIILNLSAIILRERLRKRFSTGAF